MNADLAIVFPAAVLFAFSLAMTIISFWLAGKLAPWFLEEGLDPPTIRSYFLDPAADMELTRARVVTALVAIAIVLSCLLAAALFWMFFPGSNGRRW